MGVNDSVRFVVEETEQLAEAIAFAKAGLGGDKSQLADQLFRFDVRDGQVQVTASDGNVVTSALFLATVTEPGVFAVIGKKVAALVQQARTAIAYQVDVDLEDARFVVTRQDNTVAELHFERLDPDLLQFAISAVEKAQQIPVGPAETELPREVLIEALETAASSTTRNSGNVLLDHVELRNGAVFASDGRRVSSIKSGNFHSSAKFKIPVPILGRVLNAVKSLPKKAGLFSRASENHFILSTNTRVLAIRRVQLDFPQVEALFTLTNVQRAVVRRIEVLEALKDVALGLPLGKTEIQVVLDEAELEVSAENSVGRRSKRSILLEEKFPGEPVAFSIAIEHLTSSLGVMKGDKVQLGVDVAQERSVLVDATAAREVLTVMPWRTRGSAPTPKSTSKGTTETGTPEKTVEMDDGSEIVL